MRTTFTRWPLRLAGAGLLIASAAIHLDLYLTGYRSIPTIGPLFLLQVIVGFALSLAILAIPLTPLARTWEPVVAAAAAGFAVATLGGYLLSVWVGLFGFREVRTTAGTVAGVLEVAAFAVLALLAVLTAGADLGGERPARQAGQDAEHGTSRAARLRAAAVPTVAGLTAAAAVVFGVSVATASGVGGQAPSGAAGSAALSTTTIGGVSVLTNSSGRTLYWFAPDTSSRSACYGECASYWPPVTGTPAAGTGVTLSKVGTIRRTDGSLQVTYAGHPLYTYIGDSGPGQANGNNINLNGGLWHEVTATGG
jgi:predicted lipoprotein with Yx(FWY)xxD motif